MQFQMDSEQTNTFGRLSGLHNPPEGRPKPRPPRINKPSKAKSGGGRWRSSHCCSHRFKPGGCRLKLNCPSDSASILIRPPAGLVSANLRATYHGGRHEEVPREEGSQTQNEEDDPYGVVPGETEKKVTASCIWRWFHRNISHLSRGALMAVMVLSGWSSVGVIREVPGLKNTDNSCINVLERAGGPTPG